uniref:Uncharacterized protein n=1 Tax=Anguilla anguilla TaxID=7936 RepID=A0A0E9UAC0_ANGAN
MQVLDKFISLLVKCALFSTCTFSST